MNIRRAQLTDLEEINILLKQVLDIHHEGRPDIFKANAKKYTDEELKKIIEDDTRPIFVAIDKNSVVGYAFCIFEQILNDNIRTDIKTLYIDDLCVLDTHRKQHIGKALYEYTIAYARENGFYNVTLNVWGFNEDAIGFYKACGLGIQRIGMEKIL